MLRYAALLALLPMAAAAQPVDPDWPCIQRRQPHLSLAQVWSGPMPDEAVETLAKTPDLDALGQRLSQRRLPMPEAEALIADYAAESDPQHMAALFVATFAHIERARGRVMSGITRYAHKQAALDTTIKEKRQEYDRLSAADPQDFDAIDAVEAEVDWSTRIFLDRQQSLTYVCETPVILEQRAFALGRAVMSHLQ